jgi:hypothetical protein
MKNYYFFKIFLLLLIFIPKTSFAAIDIYNIKNDTIVVKKHSSNSTTAQNRNPSLIKIANTAPEIHTTSNPNAYCPGSYTKIVNTATLLDPGNVIFEIYIQISTGYVNGQDKLSLANPSSHPTIGVSSFDITTGKLRLYGIDTSATSADFEAAIKDVVYNNSSLTPSGTRGFSITIGQANYLPSTQHYYEFIPSKDITWNNAKIAAESKNYYGLQGYLATITSLEEVHITGD